MIHRPHCQYCDASSIGLSCLDSHGWYPVCYQHRMSSDEDEVFVSWPELLLDRTSSCDSRCAITDVTYICTLAKGHVGQLHRSSLSVFSDKAWVTWA